MTTDHPTPDQAAAPVTPDTALEASSFTPDDFDTLDAILDDLRSREEDVPQWEFCEGFLAAIICNREPIADEDALAALLPEFEDETPLFASAEQRAQFMALWTRRREELARSLALRVESLADERAFSPEIMDVKGAIACLPQEEQDELAAEQPDTSLPSFGQIWALGFMFVVENWTEDWVAPRDPEVARWLDDSLQKIVVLTEDDTGTPTENMHDEDGPPSVSEARLGAFGEALWAVYDIRQIWSSLGPRVGTYIKTATPGRNDPCPCGSGKKYKKCCGA
jgi:uncharacterized protein